MADPHIIYLHPAKHAAELRVPPGHNIVSAYELLPVGIPSLMNALRAAGFEVLGLNPFLEALLNPGFDLRAWLAGQPPPLLFALDLHWYEHAFGALDVARLCKEVHPDVPVVLGGFTASLFADEILDAFPQVDFVLRGDGERPLIVLSRTLVTGIEPAMADVPGLMCRHRGEVYHSPVTWCATSETLDGFDFVSLDWLVHASHYGALQYSGGPKSPFAVRDARLRGHWLTIGRGCNYNCAFCGGGREAQARIAGRSGVVLRSPARVVDDVERLQASGVSQVLFNLDPSVLGRGFWSPLFREMQGRDMKIGLYNEFFQLPDDEFLEAFLSVADPRFSAVAITPLSGSEEVRRRNGKTFTNERLMAVLSRLRSGGMPVRVFFSLNVPGETEKSFRQTLRLARAIRTAYPPQLLGMVSMVHTLDPFSPMSREPAEHGIRVHFASFMDYYEYGRETAVVAIQQASLDRWRGYGPVNKATASLEIMARQWDRFAAEHRDGCAPVPRGW